MSLTFEACAAASSSLSQVSVFMVILFYMRTARCSCFVKSICQFGQGTYDSPHAACLHIAQLSHFNSYEIYTLLSYLTKSVY